jgi:hypothetical protein
LCSTNAGASCWTDANRDGFAQANELIGTPSVSGGGSYDLETGIRTAVGSTVDPSAKIARTRELTLGLQRELIGDLAVGADFIYRRYDHGTEDYDIGYQPGAAGFPLSQIYQGPSQYTDPVTGKTANYYTIPQTVLRPSGLGEITVTDVRYEDYKGVDLTLNKRYSNGWQANVAITLQTRNDFNPVGSYNNPTGLEYRDGTNAIARYLIKFNGSYDLPWGIMASTNLNINDGGIRTMSIDGPGQVDGGMDADGDPRTLNYNTLNFETRGSTRYERTALWDMGIHKTFTFRGGQNRLKLMVDGFNILNAAPILRFGSNYLSSVPAAGTIHATERIRTILPPRIFRFGATISF